MRQFWIEILLAAVVGVFAIMFLGGSFQPQKDAQAVMADSTNQSIASVKSNVSSSSPAIIQAGDVLSSVANTCTTTNTAPIRIFVRTTTPYATTNCYTTTTTTNTRGIETSVTMNGVAYTSTTTTATCDTLLEQVTDLSKFYTKMQSGNDIVYIQQ